MSNVQKVKSAALGKKVGQGTAESSALLLSAARQLIMAIVRRHQLFPEAFMADAGMEIMLRLFIGSRDHPTIKRVDVIGSGSLSRAQADAAIGSLIEAGLVAELSTAHLALTPLGAAQMSSFLAGVVAQA